MSVRKPHVPMGDTFKSEFYYIKSYRGCNCPQLEFPHYFMPRETVPLHHCAFKWLVCKNSLFN